MLLNAILALLALDLSPQTAPRLRVAWTYHTQAAAPNKRAAQIAAFEATPVLHNGLLYVITPFNQVIALDPETGRELHAVYHMLSIPHGSRRIRVEVAAPDADAAAKLAKAGPLPAALAQRLS